MNGGICILVVMAMFIPGICFLLDNIHINIMEGSLLFIPSGIEANSTM